VYQRNRLPDGGTATGGHIGNEILRRFRVTFDYPHKRIFFAPNRLRNKPFELDMSGLVFGPSYRVASVAPASSAELAGLQVGDVIVSLDGTPVSQLGLAQSHDLLMRDRTDCRVEVKRGERLVSAKLSLRRQL